MKQLFTIIIIIGTFANKIQAQDIINTLGANGSFLVNKNDGTNYLKIDSFGRFNLGGGPGSSYINGGRDLNLVKEGSSSGITLTAISNGANSRARIDFAKANGTIGSLSTLVDNDEVSYLSFYGHDGSGYNLGAYLGVSVDGNVTPGNIPMQFDFFTNDISSRLTIKEDGKVGISTNTPTSTMEVSGSLSLSNFVTIANSYTMGDSDYTLIGVNTGTLTVNLPEVTSAINGRIYVIKRRSDTIDISPFTGQSIDGLTTFTLDEANEFVVIQAIYQDAPLQVATWVAIGGKY
ncbi:hypothetical protein [Winogradskyella sp.]|uniref:hypothetical protein n=1 Tax=Winogradskyella sp. TaxID=1883156 RepID=UPI0035C85EC8